MEGIDLWRLCDELSIVHAALLIAGEDPAVSATYVENWDADRRPVGYEAVKTAITNALRNKVLNGMIVPKYVYKENGFATDAIPGTVDLNESWLDVASLKRWLFNRGVRTGFFFPEGTGTPDYLNPTSPRYAPKLAAAVQAWLAVENAELGGKSPKQMLAKS